MEKASPKQAVEGVKIPVLLIHGLNDRNISPFHSDEIQAHNPSEVVVWKVPGAVHTGAHKAAAQEFERRVLSWFESHAASDAEQSRRSEMQPSLFTLPIRHPDQDARQRCLGDHHEIDALPDMLGSAVELIEQPCAGSPSSSTIE
jgi:hypothetical protein